MVIWSQWHATPKIWDFQNFTIFPSKPLFYHAIDCIKPNHSWNPYRIINVFVLKISHNPGQNLLRQILKIQ